MVRGSVEGTFNELLETEKLNQAQGNSFETAIIERYRCQESSLAEVSVKCVKDSTEASMDSKVSPTTISELNKKAYVYIEDWHNRSLQDERYLYVYVDGIYLHCASTRAMSLKT